MPESSFIIVSLLFSLLLLISFLLRVMRIRKIKQQQMTGKIWLKLMAVLLGHIQQHRGLTNGFIGGGKELINEIEPLQLRIKRDISDIEDVDEWVKKSDRWLSMADHWRRLSGSYSKKDSENNLKEHNALIQNLLFLIDDMAQAHSLLLLDGMQLLWRELLTTAEYIGQARAIGTGLSAIGSCDSVSRIRLNYLCQKIMSQSQLVWGELKLDADKEQLINELVTCIQEKIVTERVSITPKEYFDIASQAINQLYDQYSKKIDQHFGRLVI